MPFILFILILICPSVQADVYVVYKSDNKEVISISNQDDAVVPAGYSKEIIFGELSDYPLDYNANDYRFVNKRFVVNMAKINARQAAIATALEKQEELDKIEKKFKRMAYEQLKSEGVIFKHINDNTFK